MIRSCCGMLLWPAKTQQQCAFDSTMYFVLITNLCLSNLQHGQGSTVTYNTVKWDSCPSEAFIENVAKSDFAIRKLSNFVFFSHPCPQKGQCQS